MLHYRYRLTLESPALLMAPAGRRTQGGLPGLDFIPGTMLLGAVARAYADFDDPWLVFHSGKVQFGDARIELADGATRPLPLAWHQPKGHRPVPNHWDPSWTNRALTPDADAPGAGPRQQMVGGRHITPDGWLASTEASLALKTAVDFATQRAAEGQLFHEPVLAANQTFAGTIRFADDVPAATRDAVLDHLAGQPVVQVGRRRSTGRGRARLQVERTPQPNHADWASAAAPVDGHVFMWLISEVALFDPVTDQPTLVPNAQAHFGAPPGVRIDWSRSFLRPARWTPFNSHRKRPDVERRVLKAGSVVCLAGVDTAGLAQIRAACADGVGSWRAEGLGQLHVHPKLLTRPALDAPTPAAKDESTQAHDDAPKRLPAALDALDQGADARLVGWLRAGGHERLLRPEAEASVETASPRFEQAPAHRSPTPSQWQQVRLLAKAFQGRPGGAQALHDALFLDEGLCNTGVAAQKWQPPGGFNAAQALSEFLNTMSPEIGPLAVGLLADRIAKYRQREAAK